MDTQNNPNTSEVSPVEGAAPETLEGSYTALTAERDKLAAEVADLQNRLRYARAEFDNARRRAERERSDYLQFAAMDLVKDILPILDDFERALQGGNRGPELRQRRRVDLSAHVRDAEEDWVSSQSRLRDRVRSEPASGGRTGRDR